MHTPVQQIPLSPSGRLSLKIQNSTASTDLCEMFCDTSPVKDLAGLAFLFQGFSQMVGRAHVE